MEQRKAPNYGIEGYQTPDVGIAISDIEDNAVVITGLGSMLPVGLTLKESFEGLINGKSGLSSIELDGRPYFAGVINGFDDKSKEIFGPIKDRFKPSRYHRSAQIGVATTLEALNQAGLLDEEYRIHKDIGRPNISVVGASGIGGGPHIRESGMIMEGLRKTALLREIGFLDNENKINPKIASNISPEMMNVLEIMGVNHDYRKDLRQDMFGLLHVLLDRGADGVSLTWNIEGPVFSAVSACASGPTAVALGKVIIDDNGKNFDPPVDIVIVPTHESTIDSVTFQYFDSLGALSNESDINRFCTPLDANRGGIGIGEAAGTLILERWSFAKQRGAVPLAVIEGVGLAADGYHETRPNGIGAGRSMKQAIRNSLELLAGEKRIGLKTHTTGTPGGDNIELEAADKEIPSHIQMVISAFKGMTFHNLGGGGAELAMIVMSLLTGVYAPIPNMVNRDPSISNEQRFYVPIDSPLYDPTIQFALGGANGFGGKCAYIAFRRVRL